MSIAKLFVCFISIQLGIIVDALELGKFEVYVDSTRSNRKFAFSGESLLTEKTSLAENTYFEVEVLDHFDGSKIKPVQVALLLSEVGFTGSVLGVLPSIQVPMQTSSAGGTLFRASLSSRYRRYSNPAGGLFTIELLVANSPDSILRKPLGQVRLPVFSVEPSILPRIDHQFKPPSPRSNWFISILFLALVVVVPLGSFGTGLKYLRMNTMGLDRISGFFFAGIFSFLLLIAMFFIALNLVQTVSLALLLSIPMCVVGNKLLCQMRTCGDLNM